MVRTGRVIDVHVDGVLARIHAQREGGGGGGGEERERDAYMWISARINARIHASLLLPCTNTRVRLACVCRGEWLAS